MYGVVLNTRLKSKVNTIDELEQSLRSTVTKDESLIRLITMWANKAIPGEKVSHNVWRNGNIDIIDVVCYNDTRYDLSNQGKFEFNLIRDFEILYSTERIKVTGIDKLIEALKEVPCHFNSDDVQAWAKQAKVGEIYLKALHKVKITCYKTNYMPVMLKDKKITVKYPGILGDMFIRTATTNIELEDIVYKVIKDYGVGFETARIEAACSWAESASHMDSKDFQLAQGHSAKMTLTCIGLNSNKNSIIKVRKVKNISNREIEKLLRKNAVTGKLLTDYEIYNDGVWMLYLSTNHGGDMLFTVIRKYKNKPHQTTAVVRIPNTTYLRSDFTLKQAVEDKIRSLLNIRR